MVLIMKDKVEMKYVSEESGYWELTVNNNFVGEQVVRLDSSNALIVAIAIATARDIGRKEESLKKKNDKHK